MGDVENVLQSSKKRVVGRKLTCDTLIDNEEDDADLEAGTFKKAVRRFLQPENNQSKKAKNEETKQPESKAPGVEDKSTSNNDVADRKNAGKELAQTQTPKQDTYILPPVNYHSLLAPVSLCCRCRIKVSNPKLQKMLLLFTNLRYVILKLRLWNIYLMNCNLSKLAMFASPLGSHLFCTILWMLWYARNQAVFSGATTDPVNLAHRAVQFIQTFNPANVKQRPQPPRWGLILKNKTQTGIVTHSKCKLESVEVDPCLAEALGVRWALQEAMRLGIQRLMLSLW
ncbi:hypothetical protein MTR_3g032750 [Medicago truncatula]|uniref:Uncharacterized protein n=1 Tax=Medicago truncatula TaxID=3880 RepID=G7J0T0_MEDTR|nr:hypothetical protein MTR_3g032750 [Medicago truncatula]